MIAEISLYFFTVSSLQGTQRETQVASILRMFREIFVSVRRRFFDEALFYKL